MNKTKIDWADYTFNPVTGCLHGCPYCYARRMAHRFHRSFEPAFHPERLDEPFRVKKPSRIFVCSTADLFGDWVPREWIVQVGETVMAYPWHTYIFLTKNPKRYAEFNPWPDNCWLGTTITNQADYDNRWPEMLKAQAKIRFCSAEPLFGDIDLAPGCICDGCGKELNCNYGSHIDNGPSDAPELCGYPVELPFPDWIIIGAQTGPGAVKPKESWILILHLQAKEAGIPVFEKNNLLPYYGYPLIQEFPK